MLWHRCIGPDARSALPNSCGFAVASWPHGQEARLGTPQRLVANSFANVSAATDAVGDRPNKRPMPLQHDAWDCCMHDPLSNGTTRNFCRARRRHTPSAVQPCPNRWAQGRDVLRRPPLGGIGTAVINVSCWQLASLLVLRKAQAVQQTNSWRDASCTTTTIMTCAHRRRISTWR